MREIVDAGEFLADTKWGELDLLLLNLPPGTDRDLNHHADSRPYRRTARVGGAQPPRRVACFASQGWSWSSHRDG